MCVHAGVIVEPISNTAGIMTPTHEYQRMIRDICTKYDVTLTAPSPSPSPYSHRHPHHTPTLTLATPSPSPSPYSHYHHHHTLTATTNA